MTKPLTKHWAAVEDACAEALLLPNESSPLTTTPPDLV